MTDWANAPIRVGGEAPAHAARHHSPSAQVRTRFSAHPQWLLSGPIFALITILPISSNCCATRAASFGFISRALARLGGGEHLPCTSTLQKSPHSPCGTGFAFLGAPNSLSMIHRFIHPSLHISSFFKSLLYARSSNSVVTLFPSFLQWVSTSSPCQPRPSFSFSLSRSA